MLFFHLSETLFYFSPSIKTTFILILFFITIGSFFIFSVIQIKKYFKANTIDEISIGSKEIGNHYSNIKDTLLNSIQLIESKNTSSVLLTNAAFEETYKKVKHLNFFEMIDYSKLKKYLIIFSSVLLIFFSLQFVESIKRRNIKILRFIQIIILNQMSFHLEVLTQNVKVKKGEDIVLRVKSYGIVPEDIIFLHLNQILNLNLMSMLLKKIRTIFILI